MEERVHPIPFRTRKLSSPSPMILHNVMWESRPLSTIAPKPLAALAQGALSFPSSPYVTIPSFRSFAAIPYSPRFYSSASFGCVQSLSAAFTQNRLFRPECVSAGILMLTYLSTLRSKSRRFLFRPKNAYFANSPNTSHRLRMRCGEFKEGDATTRF